MFAGASKIVEYKQQAEQIHADVIAQFPSEATGSESTSIFESEPRYETLNGSGDEATDRVHWQVLDDRGFPPRPGLSRETAEVVIAHLESDGWAKTDQDTQANGYAIIDSFSKPSDADGGSWFLRLKHTIPGGDRAETMQILVSSPSTTRGDTPPTKIPPTRR